MPGTAADVVYMVCLMQAAFVLLGGLGEVLLMGGNPLYLVLPVVKVVLLLVFATKVVSGRRWAMVALIVVQGVTLVGFWLQVAAGMLPWVDFTVNLVGLLTNVVLPAAVLYLCARLLAAARAAARVVSGVIYRPLPAGPTGPAWPVGPAWPMPQDPYAPAPLITTVVVPTGDPR
jgi:hypothetical protein